jgi:hypothetical protein
VHRKWRFVSQKLFEEAQKRAGAGRRDRDVWDVVRINYDVAVLVEIEQMVQRRKVKRSVWRVGNVENIKLLSSDPKMSKDLSGFEVASEPCEVSVDDPKAVFSIRWYLECSDDGVILPGFQNSDHVAAPLCECTDVECHEHGLCYYLPMSNSLECEPVTEISNNAVIDSVQMSKIDGLSRVWKLACGNKQLVMDKFCIM